MSKNQETLVVEKETFLNKSKDEASPSKRSFIHRLFHYNIQRTKSENTLQQIEITDLNGDAINSTIAENKIERMKWDSFPEYVLSIIGFVIDLGNVWR